MEQEQKNLAQLNAALSPALLPGASSEDGRSRFARYYARPAQPFKQGCAGQRPNPQGNPTASCRECFSIHQMVSLLLAKRNATGRFRHLCPSVSICGFNCMSSVKNPAASIGED